MKQVCAVILAQQSGNAIKSKYPKAMAQVLFKPMVCWIADRCKQAQIQEICVVGGEYTEQLRGILKEEVKAAEKAEDFIKEHQSCDVLVLPADMPLLNVELLQQMIALHQNTGAAATLLTSDSFKQITFTAGCFAADFLLQMTEILNGEESAWKDIVNFAENKGRKAVAFLCKDENALIKAENRADLLKLNEIANKIVVDRLLEDGVNFYCRDGIVISPDVSVGKDTTIAPGTQLKGKVTIGEDCVIGPNTVIEDSQIGDGCQIHSSLIEQSSVGNRVKIGPNSHLRPNSSLADAVKIGNFVEIKNASLGEKTSVAHLTYIGDSDFGSHINVGCGVVTVNYNGYQKFRSRVEDDAFIGCNTNLVSPVHVGKGAYIAAGSTITSDVQEDSMAIARARQQNKEGWAKRYRETQTALKAKQGK